MCKPGESLQRLVEAIERSVQSPSNVIIESPKRMRDKDTGRLREHDVVLTIRGAHHTLLVAIECRDRSRKVGVPAIEAFSKKCERTGVNMAVVVSSSGFTTTAVQKAKSLNIRCMSLEEAAQVDWCLMSNLRSRTRHLLRVNLEIIPEDERLFGEIELFREGFGLVDGNKLGLDCMNQWQDGLDDAAKNGDEKTQRFNIQNASDFYVTDNFGQRCNAKSLFVECVYRVEEVEIPLQFYSYSDAEVDGAACSIAIAPITFGSASGSMMLVNRGEDGIQVSWVPDATGTLILGGKK